jgi:hypothetical protein
VDRVGVRGFPGNDAEAAKVFGDVQAAGPEVLGEIIRSARVAGKPDLAAVAVAALGQSARDGKIAISDPRLRPLIEALATPGRRVQFAAARALVELHPREPFAGSSQVVPTLSTFITDQGPSRAVVIDGNTSRGGQLASFLATLGFDPKLARTGDEGFRFASATANVDLITVDPHMTEGAWNLDDTLANLRADARTAAIPTYVVGPLQLRIELFDLPERFPGVRLIVTPTDASLLEQQLGDRPAPLSTEERAAYAEEAVAVLTQVAAEPSSPLYADLIDAELPLAAALNDATTGPNAAAVLGVIPDPNAQRSLMRAVLNPILPMTIRQAAVQPLVRSIQRFGPLVTAEQERDLVALLQRVTDPNARASLAAVFQALRQWARPEVRRLPVIAGPAPLPPGPAPLPPPEPEKP